MVVACHPHWKRKAPSRKTRDAVLDALTRCGPLTALEIAIETGKRLAWICPALDSLRVNSRVWLDDDAKFRKVE